MFIFCPSKKTLSRGLFAFNSDIRGIIFGNIFHLTKLIGLSIPRRFNPFSVILSCQHQKFLFVQKLII
jgi:hypothetical protein